MSKTGPALRSIAALAAFGLGLSELPTASYARDVSWDASIINKTLARADDLEAVFSGTGGITGAKITGNPAGAGAAKICAKGNTVSIRWGPGGFPFLSTVRFEFTTTLGYPVAWDSWQWTKKVALLDTDIQPIIGTDATSWVATVSNHTGGPVDGFDASFVGVVGSIHDAILTRNGAGAGPATIAGSADTVSIHWGPPGLADGSTFAFQFQTDHSAVAFGDSDWAYNGSPTGDQPRIGAVPEPGSAVLLAAGIIGWLCARGMVRRRPSRVDPGDRREPGIAPRAKMPD